MGLRPQTRMPENGVLTDLEAVLPGKPLVFDQSGGFSCTEGPNEPKAVAFCTPNGHSLSERWLFLHRRHANPRELTETIHKRVAFHTPSAGFSWSGWWPFIHRVLAYRTPGDGFLGARWWLFLHRDV